MHFVPGEVILEGKGRSRKKTPRAIRGFRKETRKKKRASQRGGRGRGEDLLYADGN